MAFAPLDNPLERLDILPTTMNWRGNWDATEQYYKNDVVVSPSNSASYILNGKTTLLGGADPTLNPDWIELSLPTTGVASVGAGVGLALDPLSTATNPILDNAGVITLTAGAGMTVDNTDAQNPIVENNGVISVVAGAGIFVDNTNPQAPSIENIGVHSVGAGSYMQLNPLSTPQIPVLDNNGVHTVSSAGTGINVDNTDPNNPIISNLGVITVSAGAGITVSNLSLVGNVQISNNAEPTLCFLEITGNTPVAGPNPLQTTPFNDQVEFLLTFPTPPVSSKFLDILQDPAKGGGFLMDFSAFGFYLDQQNITPPSQIGCGLKGFKSGGGPPVAFDFPISASNGGEINFCGNAAPPLQNFVATGGQVYLDLAAYRVVSVGTIVGTIATAPQRLYFKNLTGLPLYPTSFPRKVMLRYYPNGLQ